MSILLKISLRAKLLVMSSIILTITVLSLIGVSYTQTRSYVMESYTSAQHNVAENIARIVDERLSLYATNIETLSKSIVIENSGDMDRYQNAIDSAHKSLKLLNLLVAFEDGTLKTHSGFKIQPGYDHRVRDWYKDGIKENGLFLTKAYMDANVQVPCITMTYPIIAKDGTKGVVSFDIILNFDILFEEVANKKIGGKFYVLEPDGTIISTIDDSLILKNSSDVYSKELSDFISKVVSGEISSKTEARYDLHGSQRVGVLAKMENFDIYLLYGANLSAVTGVVTGIAMKSLIFGAILLVLSNIVMMFTINYSLRDLKNFQKQITEVANSNDLTRKIISHTNDELGEIAEAVNVFIVSMSRIINEVKNSIIEVASANNELAATMEELSATFSSQSSQVSDMVDGMGEVSEISRNTSDALAVNMQSLEDTANATRVETEKLDTVSQEMGLIERDTVELSENIRSLSASSAEIGNILGVINDIANQTNLLALNAAIEAARAGEAGRGFAVVADEVRKLAERTQDATKEIENIIGTLQRETETATQAMDKSVESVHIGTENIRNVTEEIKRAVENVTHLYTDMRPVADSVANQYIKIEGAVNNARSVSSGIDESNSAVNEVNNTVSHLQQRTEYLKRLIEQFKV